MNETTAETLVINVMAAMIGLSYPIFLQIITSLDTKYSSIRIASRFRKEPLFIVYSILTAVLFFWMVYVPFAPAAPAHLSESYFWNHSARIIALIILSLCFISMGWMIRITFIYFTPLQLLQRIARESEDIYQDENRFNIFVDLLKYSIREEDLNLFLEANSIFGGCIGLCRKDKDKEVITYPLFIYNCISEITRLSIKVKSINPYVANPVNFIVSIFNEFGTTLISSDSFRNLWVNCVRVCDKGEDDWILGYWAYANQLVSYTMQNRVNDSRIEKATNDRYKEEQEKFIEQHYLLGAYLMYKGRIELLRKLVRYRISTFDRRSLVPYTLDSIIEMQNRIDGRFDSPVYLQTNYPFFVQTGIGENEMIQSWLMKYYLFCIIEESISNPTPADKIFTLSEADPGLTQTEFIDSLRNVLFNNLSYFISLGYKDRDLKNNIDDRLEAIRDQAEQNYRTEINKTDITEKERNEIERKCKDGLQEAIHRFPTHTDQNKDDYSKSFETSVSVAKENVYLFKNRILSALPDTIVAYFVKLISLCYLNQLYSAFKTYNVDYTEINDVLDKLKIDTDRYEIIGSGGIDKNMNPMIERTVNGHDANIYIFPKGKVITVSEKIELNVSKQKEAENIRLVFNATVSFRTPSPFRFLKLRIINGLFDGRKSNASDIESINQIMPV